MELVIETLESLIEYRRLKIMKRKLISLFLTLAIVIMPLAGCSQSSNSPESSLAQTSQMLGAWDKSPRRYIGKLKMERIHRKYA